MYGRVAKSVTLFIYVDPGFCKKGRLAMIFPVFFFT